MSFRGPGALTGAGRCRGVRAGRVWERGVVHSTHIRAWQSHGSDWIANRIVSCKQRGGRRVWTSAHRTQADDDRLQDGGDGGVMLNKDLAMAEGEGYGGDVVAATTESSVAALELNKLIELQMEGSVG